LRDVLASQRTATSLAGPVLVAMPVRGSARRTAVLVVAFERQPMPQDVEALELVASQAGPALENAERFRQERRAKTLAEVSSLKDPLTGAGNRRKGGMLLDQLRSGDAIVIVDIDDFKGVNDVRGHGAGDDLLRAFVSCARRTLRSSDEIVRYGGDEFLLLLPNGGDVAPSAVERLRDAWRTLRPAATFSAGIAIRDEAEAPAVTLAKADRALYAAKDAGRDATRRYEDLPAAARNAS
jgi:diguanylate cyclase (GGDEF)-like protein